MLSAFIQNADGSLQTVDDLERARQAVSGGSVVWIDVEAPSEADLAALGRAFRLDAGALEDCLRGEQRPRIDDFDEYIFLIMYGVQADAEDLSDPRKLAAFRGSGFVITVHPRPLRALAEVRARCARHPAHVIGRGVDFVLYTVIDGMVDNFERTVDSLETRLDQLEQDVTEPDVDDSVLERSADLRRDLLELRRLAASQRELVMPLSNGEYAFISDALETSFRHVRDHLTKVVETIDGLRELLNGVRDSYHSVLSNRLNEVMKTLTIFASIMLPLTFIVGIYGMNLPLWPDPTSPVSSWFVVGVMAAVAVGMLWYFRRKRWL